MLTKSDLQQIALLFDKKFDEKFDEKLAPIYRKLEEHDQQFIAINNTLKEHSKTLKQHSRDLKTLKKNQEVMLDTLDRTDIALGKRLDRVEAHLGLPSFYLT